MQAADERLADGDVDGALQAITQDVRARPDDAAARLYLASLLSVLEQWDRALSQFKALGTLSPEARVMAGVYAEAALAEQTRTKTFAGEQDPPPAVSAAPWFEELLGALHAETTGDPATAQAKRTAAFDAAPDTPGTLDGEAFAWIGDGDVRFGPCLEVIVGGRYGLLPFDSIARLRIEAPRDLRDLVWAPATLTLAGGQTAAALLPVRYPGAGQDADGAVRLAKTTHFSEDPDGPRGRGQHVFVTDAGEKDLLSVRDIVFSGKDG